MGNLGGVASVYCESMSISDFEITWYKKVGNLTENGVHTRMVSKKIEDHYIKRIHMDITNLTEKDTGVYYCVAKNVGGEEKKSVNVRIKSKYSIFFNLTYSYKSVAPLRRISYFLKINKFSAYLVPLD